MPSMPIEKYEFIKGEIERRTGEFTEQQIHSLIGLMENLAHISQRTEEETLRYIDRICPDGRSDEIRKVLSMRDMGIALSMNTPHLKTLTKRGARATETEEAIKLFLDNDFTIKRGKLTVFQKAVFDVLARAYYQGRVTSDGMIVLEKGQAGRWFTACKGTPGNVAMNDFLNALLEMREQPLDYSTTADLADIIGLEATILADSIPGLKTAFYSFDMKEHILDKVDIIENRYKRRGQFVDVYLIKPGNLTLKLLQAMPWYMERPQDFYQVKYLDQTGKLKKLGYSKQRKSLQTYIFDKVFSKRRGNDVKGGRKFIPGKIPFEEMFLECGLNVEHAQERKNRIEDAKRIFEHLAREGEIYSFSVYDTKKQREAGIEFQLSAVPYGQGVK